MIRLLFTPVTRAIFAIGLSIAAAQPLCARTLIKLTTLAPKDSSYHRALQRLGQEWKKASGGDIDLVIYPGGIQGGESAMIKRMKIGQVQAAMVTAVGLSEIEPAVAGLQSMPMMFRNFEEVDFIGTKLQPDLEAMLAEKGFVVLFWSDAGWVRHFSKRKMLTPDDMKKMKLFSWSGGTNSDAIAKRAGFNPVPLETADILPGLQTGLIDAVAMPPFYALSSQIYTVADNLLELPWAPLVGATIVNKKTWDKIPPDTQEAMRESALKTGQLIKETARNESREAVKTMQEKWGLAVHRPTEAQLKQWRDASAAIYPDLRGEVIPADIWDKVVKWLEEYRAKAG
jgi:TRAP-type C4-dicarboxylate transport system substrate-binding protein